MSRARSKKLMIKAGVGDLPLSHCRTLAEFNQELAKLSDSQLLDAWSRTLEFATTRLSDAEILSQLDKARQHNNNNQDSL